MSLADGSGLNSDLPRAAGALQGAQAGRPHAAGAAQDFDGQGAEQQKFELRKVAKELAAAARADA